MRQLAPDESEHDTRALEAEALEGWPQETPFISTTAGLAEESFELVESKEEFGALSGPDGQPEHERPVVQGPAGTAPAVRILWPALGFPAVIAPGAAPPPGASGPHVARSATVLLLSNRETLTSADAARYLRVVPWEQRTRAYIPEGQPGCFAATDLRVRSDSPAGVLTRSQTDGRGDAISFGGDRYEDSIIGSLSKAVRSFYARQGLRYLHEVRISEQACAKLADGQYHHFWNGDRLPQRRNRKR
jgi:hypothetical protein